MNRIMIYENKQFYEKPFFLLFIPLFIFYLVAPLMQTSVLALPITYVTQYLIFAFLIIGYQRGMKDRHFNAQSVFRLTPSGFKRPLSILFSLFLFAFVFSALLFLSYVFVIFTQHAEFSWVIEGARYALLYFFLPSCISGVIGLLVSLRFHNKTAYLLLLLIGVILGPLSTFLLGTVFSFLFINNDGHVPGFIESFVSMIQNINLGEYAMGIEADPLYGFATERLRIFRVFAIFLFLVGLYLFLTLRKMHYKSKRPLTLLSGACLFIAVICAVVPSGYTHNLGKNTAIGAVNKDYIYYQQLPHEEESLSEIKVKKIAGDLDLRNQLSFEGTLFLSNPTQEDTLDFALYHDLKLQSLSIAGTTSEVTREGDKIRVTLDEPQENLELSIAYSGETSPLFYAGEKGVFLPSMFPFFPIPSKTSIFYNGENGLTLRDLHFGEVEYDLTVRSRVPIVSNLESDGSKLKGVLQDNLTLIGGHLIEHDIESMTVYEAGPYNTEHASTIASRSNELLFAIQNDFGLDVPEKTTLVFSGPLQSDLFNGLNLIQEGETLFMPIFPKMIEDVFVLYESVGRALRYDASTRTAAESNFEIHTLIEKMTLWLGTELQIDMTPLGYSKEDLNHDQDALYQEIIQNLEDIRND